MKRVETQEAEDYAEDVQTYPDGLDPDEQLVYKEVLQATSENNGFREVVAEMFARNPELCKRYTDDMRKRTVEKVAGHLSECQKFVDLPLEIMEMILALPFNDMQRLSYAIAAISSANITMTKDEVKESVDLARVIHVMDEEREKDVYKQDQVAQQLSNLQNQDWRALTDTKKTTMREPDRASMARRLRGKTTPTRTP